VSGDGIGTPKNVSEGSGVPEGNKVVVPERFGADLGDTFDINGAEFEVGGVVPSAALFAGAHVVYMTDEAAQALYLGDQRVWTMLLVRSDGVPEMPEWLTAFDRDGATEDLLRPVANALDSVNLIMVLLWIVAALIVASVVYITTLERTRDIAVFKATGVGTGAIAVGICAQAVATALTSALIGAVIALFAQSRFPMEIVIPASALWTLPLLAILVGIVAGLVGVRRSVKIDPATAFGGP
jgi:putative ABC transport system permease protein